MKRAGGCQSASTRNRLGGINGKSNWNRPWSRTQGGVGPGSELLPGPDSTMVLLRTVQARFDRFEKPLLLLK